MTPSIPPDDRTNSNRDDAAARYVGAIDQGTTGTRFLVYDRSARPVTSAYAGHEPIRPAPGHVEHDPTTLWENTVKVVERACDQADIRAEELAAIGVASQRATVVLWDAETGQPVANAIVWQDMRTANRTEELRDNETENLIRDRTGLVPDTYFPATKLEWLLDETDVRTNPEGIHFGTVDSWLLYNLTGTHATDVTNAAQTMLFDIENRGWDEELLSIFDVPREILPTVHPSSDSDVYGETTVDGYFDAPVPITAALGDQQAALLGNGCFEAGDLKVSYGAGSFAHCNTGTDRVHSGNNLLSTIVYQEAGSEPIYALEGPIFTGGAAFDWLLDVGIIDSAGDIETVVDQTDHSEGVYLVPGFRGLAAPHWNQSARGLLVGVTPDTTRGHLVRAAVESISYRVREVVDAIGRDVPMETDSICVDSGLAENDQFCGLQADVLGTSLDRSGTEAPTALGAAYAAGRAIEYWSQSEFAAQLESAASFTPSEDTDYEPRYEQWARAVELATRWTASPYSG
ncbi:FGGY family carbohydrate kinase (plasmid) [Haloarcula sp. NS06]|uniref:FGGY family carbohydrate kinase n=1 Tax=Haloarcula sp. NS06 TaxID=3409688 RepID=UPI003DA73940